MIEAPLTIEHSYNAPVDRVWNAIIDKEQMKQWYFELSEFKPEVGFEFEFTGGTEEKQYRHLCKVTEVVPLKKLQYSWRYDGYGGISFVTFDLFAERSKTRVRLTHEGLESFPTNPDFARSNFEAGWTDILSNNLRKFLQ